MGGFFSLDGAFYKYGTILADMMIVGVLWFICCIPIVTIGASTTSMYYIMTRKHSDRDGYMFRDFFASFKKNFKTATLSWLTILVVAIILALNILNIDVMGEMGKWILPFQIVLAMELGMILLYIFPILSRFEIGYVNLFKTSFYMANKHLLTTIMLVILMVGMVLVVEMMPPFILICAGVYSYITSIMFLKVFRKYRPELDKDEDELKLEMEAKEALAAMKLEQKEKKAKMKAERKKR